MFTDTNKSSSRSSTASVSNQEENSAPMMAVFGGMFALMLVFLLVVNVVSEAALQERLRDHSDNGEHRIQREDGGFGYSIIVFPEAIRIVETAEGVSRDELCDPGSPYRRYAQRVYENSQDQLLFFLLEGSVTTMAKARDCIRTMWPGQEKHIGWVIADNEFLKSVLLDDIPEYIKDHVDEMP